MKLSDKGYWPLKRRKVKALGIRTNYLLIRLDSSLTAALQPLPTLFLTELFVPFSHQQVFIPATAATCRSRPGSKRAPEEATKPEPSDLWRRGGASEKRWKVAAASNEAFLSKKNFETNAMLIFFRLLRSFSNFLLLVPSQQICDLRYVLEEVSFQMVFE